MVHFQDSKMLIGASVEHILQGKVCGSGTSPFSSSNKLKKNWL